MLKKIIFILIILNFSSRVFAYHIIGGEIYYDRLTGNDFKITLKLYRDCSNPDAAEYDDPLQIYIYNSSGILVDSLVIPFPGSIDIDPDATNPCMTDVPDLCVQQAIYTGIINLPNSAGGYDIVYQRCCRNSTIINIYDPLYSGATYTEHIPDPASMINSCPRFDNFPPILICGNYPFTFDHAATDPDGDALVYEFFTPYLGATYAVPDPTPAPPPPYDPVDFYPPFSEDYPIESSPPFSIDPSTGYLIGTPTAFGQFVVGIAVKEYRAGVLIGTHYRDFQFNITDCTPSIVAAMPSQINNCNDYTIHFENWSYGTSEYYWDFGVPGITTDISTEETPVYTYPDTGTYTVMLIAFPGQTCSDTAYTTVRIYPQLIINLDFENTCAQNPVQFIDLSTSDYGTLTSWDWNFGDGDGSTEENPSYTFNYPGWYYITFTVENSVGCTAEINDSILIYPLPKPNFEADNACIGQTGTIYSTSVIIAGYENIDYDWIVEPDNEFSGESFDYYFDTAGIYTVTLYATNNMGCIDSATINIIVPDPVVAQPIDGATICEGDSVQLFAGGGIYYKWFPAENISDASVINPFVFPDETTTYGVIVSDECTSDTAFVTVKVLPAPDLVAGPDTIVYHEQPVQMYAYGAFYYEWWPPDGLTENIIPNPIATPESTTQYIITGTSEDGCMSIDTALVYIIPNCFEFTEIDAFSPNGDGINDNFRLVTSGDDNLVDMEIYNRWGEKIFQTNDIVNGWDGNDMKGVAQEIGTYIYIIKTECDGILQSLSGNVTLLR